MHERSTVHGMSGQDADLRSGASLDGGARTVLMQILRIYCAGLDPVQLDDLRSSLAQGQYPWLEAAFSGGNQRKRVRGDEWSTIVGHSDSLGRSVATMRAEQQLVWSHIFPDLPFPRGRRLRGEDPVCSICSRPVHRPAIEFVTEGLRQDANARSSRW
jgi:hypothetical protein